MNKQQQIEEMARAMCEPFDRAMVGQPCTKCRTYDRNCYTIHQAEALYNAGYRKIPEDSVVISIEEYEKLKYTWITDSDAYKKGCKETAEKILNEVKDMFINTNYNIDWIVNKLKEIATREGVEIKEL